MILSGSVGLEPLLQQARLSAHANIFSPYDLHPWNEETAIGCLAALAETYEVELSARNLSTHVQATPMLHPPPHSNLLRQASRSPQGSPDGKRSRAKTSSGSIGTRC